MTRLLWTARLLAASALMLAVCMPFAHAQKRGKPKGDAYTIIAFTPPGISSVSSGVNGLNEAGDAVGWTELADGAHRAIHRKFASGEYTTLSANGSAGAASVNNLNQIVGENDVVGLFWASPSAEPVTLSPLLPATIPPAGMQSVGIHSWATDINDDGIVIGISMEFFEPLEGQYQLVTRHTGVVWRVVVDNNGVAEVDGPLPLLPLNGHLESLAPTGCLNELVNGTAQVTGYSSGPAEAVGWAIGLNTDGTLAVPGPPVSLVPAQSKGYGINNFGDVCGRWDKRPFAAFVDDGLIPRELPVPRNTQDGYALEINEAGEIVGQLDIQKPRGGQINPPKWQAYLWRNGNPVALTKQIDPSSGWERLTTATSLNNAGVIAGQGVHDVEARGFLLIPNP